MINLLDLAFELEEENFLYDDDENGNNMSYGEYSAIAEYAQQLVLDELHGKSLFEASDELVRILETCDEGLLGLFGFDDEPCIYVDEENLQNSQFCTGNEAIDRYMQSLLLEYADDLRP